MHHPGRAWLFVGAAGLIALGTAASARDGAGPASATGARSAAVHVALVDQYCVTCHDEADVLLEIRDDGFDSGRLIVPSCTSHLTESFAYLVEVEAPRRGWTYGVTGGPPRPLL